MAVPKTPGNLINGWAERIALTLLEQQAWFRHALTHGEIQILTGLNDLQVSRGCWHGRLHGLLNFEQSTGQVRYTLTPLGVAIARRLKSAVVLELEGNGGPMHNGQDPDGEDL